MTINVAHADMLLPAARPRVTIPDLWDRVRGFLACVFDEFGSPRRQLHTRLDGKQRSAILRWLKPAERMARQLLLAAAITHLLMTNEGRRLRANARPLAPPRQIAEPPPKPVPLVNTGINLWATIADYQAGIAKADALAAAKEAASPRPVTDPDDPSTWRAPFRILRWSNLAATAAPPRRPLEAVRPDPRRLIRRIEAVRRVLEAPEARIHRLAAYLARLPRGALGLPPPQVRHRGRPNPILSEDIFALHELVDTAVEVFNTS